jgi:hypothetical protein
VRPAIDVHVFVKKTFGAAKKSISPRGSQSVCTPQSAHLLTSFDSDIVREPTSPGKHFVVGCGAEVPSRPR